MFPAATQDVERKAPIERYVNQIAAVVVGGAAVVLGLKKGVGLLDQIEQ